MPLPLPRSVTKERLLFCGTDVFDAPRDTAGTVVVLNEGGKEHPTVESPPVNSTIIRQLPSADVGNCMDDTDASTMEGRFCGAWWMMDCGQGYP